MDCEDANETVRSTSRLQRWPHQCFELGSLPTSVRRSMKQAFLKLHPHAQAIQNRYTKEWLQRFFVPRFLRFLECVNWESHDSSTRLRTRLHCTTQTPNGHCKELVVVPLASPNVAREASVAYITFLNQKADGSCLCLQVSLMRSAGCFVGLVPRIASLPMAFPVRASENGNGIKGRIADENCMQIRGEIEVKSYKTLMYCAVYLSIFGRHLQVFTCHSISHVVKQNHLYEGLVWTWSWRC